MLNSQGIIQAYSDIKFSNELPDIPSESLFLVRSTKGLHLATNESRADNTSCPKRITEEEAYTIFQTMIKHTKETK